MKINEKSPSIHSEIFVVDSHADTFSRCLVKKEKDYPVLEDFFRGGLNFQVFALYTPEKYLRDAALFTMEMIESFYRWKNIHSNLIRMVYSKKDLNSLEAHKLYCLLSIEGGEALEGKSFMLDIYYRLGVRAMGLTWNGRNLLADGHKACKNPGGLTDFGEEVVKRMNSLGMVVDVSHMAEKGFWEVINISEKPVIASHSNCFSLCNHSRNLRDEQILAIAKRGGVTGITFVPSFLAESPKASIHDVIEHIEYVVKLTGGYDNVGIGSDFDGTDELPEGIPDVTFMPSITELLLTRGHKREDIEKIMGLNWLRVFSQIL